MERFKHPAPYVTPYRPPMPHPYGVVPTVDPPQSQWDVPPQPITNNYGVTTTPNPPQSQWDVQPHLIPPHPYDDTAPDAGNATSMAPSTPDADWWGQKPPYANDAQPMMAPPVPVTPYDHMLYGCGMMARMLGDVHPSGLPQQFDDLNNAAPFGVGNFHVTQPTPPPDVTNSIGGMLGAIGQIAVDQSPNVPYSDYGDLISGCADPAVKHTDKLPFSFYEIKSEQQASVGGTTTRPA